jgi:hypothetical protein
MKRRTFLKAVLATGAGLLITKPALAVGTLKGAICTSISPVLMNPLNVDWWRTSFGPWCINPPANMPGDWIFDLYYDVPSTSDLQASLANPYHGLWWMIGGNEAATEWNPATGQRWTAQEIATLVRRQIDAVVSVQSTAKFCLAGGIQYYAPFNKRGNPVWIDSVWTLLPQSYRDRIKAVDFHYYSQAEFGLNNSIIFDKSHIKREINHWKQWRTNKGLTVQLWLSEIGLSPSNLAKTTSPSVINYPNVVNSACVETGIERWSWYTLEGDPLYICLYGTGSDALRQTFSNI